MPMQATVLVALAAVLVLLAPGSGDARDYPFCASYNDETGARNCGFETMQQCRAAVSGAGGFCGVNPAYRPEPPSPAPAARGRAR
jgi:uncharacterized protein DUF3551